MKSDACKSRPVMQRAVRLAARSCAGLAILLCGCHGLITSTPVVERPAGAQKPTPADLAAIPDAEPRAEALHRFANNPYTVFGQDYQPARELRPFKQVGIGSWYGRKFHGQRTSSGEPYDMYAMTAAHPTLPIPSYVRVTSEATKKTVIVRVNDRGPFHSGRIIDLSYTAAAKLGYINNGSTRVEVEQILPQEFAAIAARQRSPVMAAAPVTEPRVAETRPTPQPAAAGPAVTPVAAPPPAAVPSPAKIPVDVEKSGIYLQLGAFSGRDNAENFRVRVTGQLPSSDKAVEVYQRDGLFRLHLGPYRDRAEANAAAEQIREALAFKPVVILK